MKQICADLEKQIDAINIKDYIKSYDKPTNKNQEWIDKLEFHMCLMEHNSINQKYNVNSILFGYSTSHPGDIIGIPNINHVLDQLNPSQSSLWYQAFDLVNNKYPDQFYHELDEIESPKKVITLFRKNPNKCMISNKVHEKENSYMRIIETKCSYKVSVGCNRGCTFTRGGKLKGIGTIDKVEDSYGFYFSYRNRKEI